MEGIELTKRKELGSRLESELQDTVMKDIPQFHQAEFENFASDQRETKETGVLMFNMERGVHLPEIMDFLKDCPDIFPWDVILANELDDGCYRSGNKNTARELAKQFGLNYAWGLEFIELVDERNEKGFHGNAVFSKWPIERAGVIRLPEKYNWYYDRQKRIGGRLAVWAEITIAGKHIGFVSIHLENRTDGEGRKQQMERILEEIREIFPEGMPIIMGGDLNTNTFDGRDKDAIHEIAGDEGLQTRCLEEVDRYEAVLPLLEEAGFCIVPKDPILTRRKPLPDGSFLPLRLDWILLKGAEPLEMRTISTAKEDLTYAKEGSSLAQFEGAELSDHNAVWARCRIGSL